MTITENDPVFTSANNSLPPKEPVLLQDADLVMSFHGVTEPLALTFDHIQWLTDSRGAIRFYAEHPETKKVRQIGRRAVAALLDRRHGEGSILEQTYATDKATFIEEATIYGRERLLRVGKKAGSALVAKTVQVETVSPWGAPNAATRFENPFLQNTLEETLPPIEVAAAPKTRWRAIRAAGSVAFSLLAAAGSIVGITQSQRVPNIPEPVRIEELARQPQAYVPVQVESIAAPVAVLNIIPPKEED